MQDETEQARKTRLAAARHRLREALKELAEADKLAAGHSAASPGAPDRKASLATRRE